MSETPDAGLRDDELDPDADPAMMPTTPQPPDDGPVDGTEVPSVQDDPEDEVDPDADPEMMGSTHTP